MLYLEYVWIGGNGELRSKIKFMPNKNTQVKLEDVPIWNYDGSSTGQASGKDSEVILHPVRLFNNPTLEHSKLVLCETRLPNGEPHSTNKRAWAMSVFQQDTEADPWYGMEQEYFMGEENQYGLPSLPLGYCANGQQGQYYCSVGTGNAYGRALAEEHMQACVNAGIRISGINAEVAPGQWEFQVGPCRDINSGDELWMARYLLCKIAEKYNIAIDFSPKPLKGDWNGSGCHANFSTKAMREEGGLEHINSAIEKLSKKHAEHMEVYGSGNEERMTGAHETASYDTFTDDVANRGCSVRRGNDTVKNGKGYFEDRRPSSNCDPYLVTAKLFETCCLND